MNRIIMQTQRLFLREMTMEDFDALYAVLADADIMQHYPYTFDAARVQGWIARNQDRYRTDGFGLWAVCLKTTGEMIGDCGLTLQPIDGQMLPEIGYHIRRDCQHKGYAKEAASAVRDWAFSHTEYDALYSYCKYTNVPSYRTAEAIGMRFLKTYPEEANEITHVSVITREEWQERYGNSWKESVIFRNYTESDYQKVCDFLIELNRDSKEHINWNWARFEWMYEHPEFDKDSKGAIGLWLDCGKIVGAAIYDMYFGEAFCGVLQEYKELYAQVLDYAWHTMKDASGLGVAICQNSLYEAEIAQTQGFSANEQTETILQISAEHAFPVRLPDGYRFADLDPAERPYDFQWILWQGFDHGEDRAEFEKSENIVPQIRKHLQKQLSILVKDAFHQPAAYCCLWYDPRTEYAYVEPICVTPSHRGKGIAKAMLYEALNRVGACGAKTAYVISDMAFYRHLGFREHSRHVFYQKSECSQE